jgi:hypothetical protein
LQLVKGSARDNEERLTHLINCLLSISVLVVKFELLIFIIVVNVSAKKRCCPAGQL